MKTPHDLETLNAWFKKNIRLYLIQSQTVIATVCHVDNVSIIG